MYRSNKQLSSISASRSSSDQESSDESVENDNKFVPENGLFELKTINKRHMQSNFFLSNPARIVRKSGRLNLFLKQLQNKRTRYIRDLGNTLLTIRWRWILLTLCVVNFATFFFFSFVWLLIAEVDGDFDENINNNNGTLDDRCIINVKGFNGLLVLSIETITSIGSGHYYPGENCSYTWLVLSFAHLIFILLQGTLISVFDVKMTKPYTKMSHLLFSKKAVICLRDGTLRLIFRLNDPDGKILCNTSISVYFIDKNVTNKFALERIKVEPHGLLIFPLEIEHIIDEDSPLWELDAGDMLHKRFEIVVVAEGSSIITGKMSQNRTSYTNLDIKWGHKFVECIAEEESHYVINDMNFKQTVPCYTPICSARGLREIEAASNYNLSKRRND